MPEPKEPRLDGARKLHNQARELIVSLLGAYVSERKIVDQVRETFGIEISQQAVHYYAISSTWSTKVKEARTAYSQNLADHNRLAAVEARVFELSQNAEEHQAARDAFSAGWATAHVRLLELRDRRRRAREGEAGVTPPSEAELEEAEKEAKELKKLADGQEGAWHHALGEIREEMKRGGLELSFADAGEAAEFIKAMSQKFAQAQAEGEGEELLPPVHVSDPNAEE